MEHPETVSRSEPLESGAIDALVARARAGDRQVLPQLRTLLEQRPEIWQHAGDLARHAIDSWIRLIAGPDLLARESLEHKVAALAAELAGPAASSLDKLLIERVMACWLQVHYSDAAVAQATDQSLRQAAFHQKRQNAAHRRYLSAIAALAMVRRLATTAATEPEEFFSSSASQQTIDLTNAAATNTAAERRDPDSAADHDHPIPLTVYDPPPELANLPAGDGRSNLQVIAEAS